jgi:hypothetical protein
LIVTLQQGQANVQNAVAANWQLNSVTSSVISATTSTSQKTLGFGPPVTGQITDQWQMNAVNDAGDLARLRCIFSFAARKARFEISQDKTYKIYTGEKDKKGNDYCQGQDEKKLDPGQEKVVIKFLPPDKPFIVLRKLGDPTNARYGMLECKNTIEVGEVRGYEIVACPKLYHDFELAVLAATPNTKGGEVTKKDKTGKVTTTYRPGKSSSPLLVIPPSQ